MRRSIARRCSHILVRKMSILRQYQRRRVLIFVYRIKFMEADGAEFRGGQAFDCAERECEFQYALDARTDDLFCESEREFSGVDVEGALAIYPGTAQELPTCLQ